VEFLFFVEQKRGEGSHTPPAWKRGRWARCGWQQLRWCGKAPLLQHLDLPWLGNGRFRGLVCVSLHSTDPMRCPGPLWRVLGSMVSGVGACLPQSKQPFPGAIHGPMFNTVLLHLWPGHNARTRAPRYREHLS
jgi:hypothetical protein